jgi:integrase
MTIKRIVNGYEVDLRPDGRNGKRIRKKFASKAEATRFENHILQQALNGKDWNPSNDTRRLNDLIETWFNAHGHALTGGVRQRKTLLAISKAMANPIAREFDAKLFGQYRVSRTTGEKSVSAKTVNNDQTYLNAMFNELKRLGEWEYENPIAGIRNLKHVQPQMAFLSPEQITLLFDELKNSSNPDALPVASICLRTGARWGEAETMVGSQLIQGEPCKLIFEKTKGNKRRAVPIDADFFNSLPKKNGRIFQNCWGAFRSALKRSGVELPSGQMTHSLRHTFASHFMQNGGNIMVLKDILGHASIVDTMKYSHFAPKHLEEAIRLNPLA